MRPWIKQKEEVEDFNDHVAIHERNHAPAQNSCKTINLSYDAVFVRLLLILFFRDASSSRINCPVEGRQRFRWQRDAHNAVRSLLVQSLRLTGCNGPLTEQTVTGPVYVAKNKP